MLSPHNHQYANSSKTIQTLSSWKTISDNQEGSQNRLSQPFTHRNIFAPISYCQKHPNISEDILCLTDSAMICSHCAIFQDHKDHQFLSLSDIEKELYQLQKQVGGINQYMSSQMKRSLELVLNWEQKKLEEKKTEDMRSVKMAYNKLYRELEKLEKQSYEEINDFYKKEYEYFERQLEEIEKNKKNEGYQILQNWGIRPSSLQLHDCLKVFSPYLKKIKTSPGSKITFQLFEQDLKSKILKIEKSSEARIKKALVIVEPVTKYYTAVKDFVKFRTGLENEKDFKSIEATGKILRCSKSMIFPKENIQNTSNAKKQQLRHSRASTGTKTRSPCKKFQSKNTATAPKSSNCDHFFKTQTLHKVSANKSLQTVISNFISDKNKETLDLSNINASQLANNLPSILEKVKENRPIPRLKLCRVSMTDQQFSKILQEVSSCQSVNISLNNLTETSLQTLVEFYGVLKCRKQEWKLSCINMSRNKMQEGSKYVKDKMGYLKSEFGVNVNL